jgi:hypothetical protein
VFLKIRIGVRRDGEPFELDVREYLINSGLAIIGKRGVGKSYLVGLIAERLSEIGQQFVLVDIMGQYYTLKQKYPVIVVSMGKEEYADFKVTVDMAEDIAKVILESGQSVVLDLSYATMLDQYRFMASFFKAFYDTAREVRRPVVLIIDEIHRITPERSMIKLREVAEYQNKVAYWVAEIARTGRKHGIGYVVAGQREAETAKTSLTQCEIQINFKVTGVDFENLRRKIPQEIANEVKNFKAGEAVVLGFDEEFVIKVDKRKTPHGGETPVFTPVEVDISSFLKLVEKIEKSAEESERGRDLPRRVKELESSIVDMKKRLAELEERNKQLEEENKRLRSEIKARDERIKKLEDDLATASELGRKLERIKEVSTAVVDAITEFAEEVGIELYPSDIAELIRRVRELEQKVEMYEATERERKYLVDQALSDVAVKQTIREMESYIKRELLGVRGALPDIFRQVVRFDPDTVFFVEDVDTTVTESTVRSYLRKLEGIGIIAEASLHGKRGFRNTFYAWVNTKLRRVKATIPDEAVDKVYDQLREIIIG